MKVSIYHRRRFHSDVIKRVIWLYFRFNLSLREIEEMMAERGVDVSYETIRRWIDSFGSVFAKRIKSRSECPSPRWHLDEVYTKINGKMVYLWRAVDDEGTVLDIVVPKNVKRSGHCRMKFDVNKSGIPINIKATYCTERKFKKPAKNSVKKWKYLPKISGGKPSMRRGVEIKITTIIKDKCGNKIPEKGE